MKDLIEKLKNKDYVRAFGLMSAEEQKVFEKVDATNCLFYNYHGKWECLDLGRSNFLNCNTYAIKPDYKPEPEYVDLEIVEYESGMWLGVYSDMKGIPHHFTHLHCLPSLPNFECFWYEEQPHGMSIEDVATRISEGHKVYARFRKD